MLTTKQVADILYTEWMPGGDEKTNENCSLFWNMFLLYAEETKDITKSDKEWIESAMRRCGWGIDLDGLPTFSTIH